MELRIELSDWLDRLDEAISVAAAGDTVIVTRDGRDVAQLGPRPGIDIK